MSKFRCSEDHFVATAEINVVFEGPEMGEGVPIHDLNETLKRVQGAVRLMALHLAGRGEEEAFAVLYGKFPTCAVAELEFPEPPHTMDWDEGSAYLRRVLTPRPPRHTRAPLVD